MSASLQRPCVHRVRGAVGFNGAATLGRRAALDVEVRDPALQGHVSHAMAKLGARDRAQLVVIAYQTGLVTP
jgi:hypothetical protein